MAVLILKHHATVLILCRILIKDEAGNGIPFHDLEVVHEKHMHVIFLSGDNLLFAHVHPEDYPELQNDDDSMMGIFHLALKFPQGGLFAVMVEFAVRREDSDRTVQVVDVKTQIEVRYSNYVSGLPLVHTTGFITSGYVQVLPSPSPSSVFPTKDEMRSMVHGRHADELVQSVLPVAGDLALLNA